MHVGCGVHLGLGFMNTTPSRAARAIAAIGDLSGFAPARTADSTYLYIRSAGHRHAVFEPWTPEQAELVDWLTARQASKALCEAAWDAFIAQS